MKLLLPDSLWRRDLASGALFLYFHDETVASVLHSSVSSLMTGIDPFDFFRLVEQRQPPWAKEFANFVFLGRTYRENLAKTQALLEPMRRLAFKSVWLIYERGKGAWQSAAELLGSSQLNKTEIAKLIDPFSAADELFSHIFFNMYLDLYHKDFGAQDFFRMGAEAFQSRTVPQKVPVEQQLYQYCEELIRACELADLLTTAYMFRIPLLQKLDAVLLTNEHLVEFFASLPVEGPAAVDAHKTEETVDPVAWEFFRQLVSPSVDPLTEDRVQKLSRLIEKRAQEVNRLKIRCVELASELGSESNLSVLQSKIANHIRVNIQEEVQTLLDLDRSALEALITVVFSDEKTWAGIALSSTRSSTADRP